MPVVSGSPLYAPEALLRMRVPVSQLSSTRSSTIGTGTVIVDQRRVNARAAQALSAVAGYYRAPRSRCPEKRESRG